MIAGRFHRGPAGRGVVFRWGSTLLGVLLAAIALTGCKDQSANGGSGSSGGATAGPPGAERASVNAPSGGDAILIGEYGSLTGKEATFGKSTDEGVQLAVEELNKAGGVKGKQVQVATEDDQSDASKAETAVKRLIDDKNVLAVIGEVASGSSLAGGKVCQEKGVPMITPSSTKPSVTEIGDYIFRVCFIDPFQAAVVARWAHDGLKATRVAIFTDKTAPYSVGFADNFKTAFTKMGGQIVMEQSYSGGDKDFRSALTAIQASNPQAILVPGYYADAGSIAKQARDLKISVPLLGGDGWDSPALFDTGGDAVNGCYFSDHMSVDDPKDAVQNFVKAFHAKYGADTKPDALTALAYDAANLLFDAMKRAPTLSRSAIRDAIAQTKDFPGVTGTITIDANRNASKPAVILEIKDRALTKVAEISNPEQPMK